MNSSCTHFILLFFCQFSKGQGQCFLKLQGKPLPINLHQSKPKVCQVAKATNVGNPKPYFYYYLCQTLLRDPLVSLSPSPHYYVTVPWMYCLASKALKLLYYFYCVVSNLGSANHELNI